MSSSFRLELDRWLSKIDVSADSVLDIGGSQLPVNKRVRSWDVLDYKIADLPNPHVDSPKPDIEFDMNYEVTLHEAQKIKAEVIFCLEVFDYIWNPVAGFNNVANLLKVDGKAYVSFPSQYPLHQPVEHDALRYMPAGIQKLAQNAGLVIVNMTPRRMETNFFEMYYRTERMRAAKREDHNFSGWLVEFKK